jgi:hypothetical protein
MANIRIDLNHAPLDGQTITFKAPCSASDIKGLIVYYPNENLETVSSEFTLNDANGGDIGLIDNVFSEGSIVKVIVDTDTNNAYVQNPDTNTYIESKFEELKVYTDTVASGKADADHNHDDKYYTEAEIDTALNNRATIAYVDEQDVAMLEDANAYTDEKIALLLNNSSEAVDSIMELAVAMEENDTVVEALNSAIGTKVDKVDGMGLSTNDFTTEEKEKLANIEVQSIIIKEW